jgi:acyl carrier protein
MRRGPLGASVGDSVGASRSLRQSRRIDSEALRFLTGSQATVERIDVATGYDGGSRHPAHLKFAVELARLYTSVAGRPSYREIARGIPDSIGHATVGEVLRCLKVPRKFRNTELVVSYLGGDVTRFRELWAGAFAEAWPPLSLTNEPTSSPKTPLLEWTPAVAAPTRVVEPAPTQTADQPDILRSLVAIIEDVAGIEPSELLPDRRLVEDLEIDSLSMVEIAVRAEDEFGVAIPDEAGDKVQTIRQAVAFIEQCL